MKEIIVKNCHECPFANNDNEYGRDYCNHPDAFIVLYGMGELPRDQRHKDCPLNNADIIVKADNLWNNNLKT